MLLVILSDFIPAIITNIKFSCDSFRGIKSVGGTSRDLRSLIHLLLFGKFC